MIASITSTIIKTLSRQQFPRSSLSSFPSLSTLSTSYKYSSQPHNNSKFKVVDSPSQAHKLVFNSEGKCRIFEHKNGEREMKWIMRVGTFFTVLNSILLSLEMSYPVFGAWNMFSFSMCAGLGYLFLVTFHVLAKRTVHKIDLNSSLQTVDVTFFSPFWKPRTINFHISQFQQPHPTYANFVRFELTSLGKAWIKLIKNQYRGVQDYQQTLDSILLGKKITNVAIKSNNAKH